MSVSTQTAEITSEHERLFTRQRTFLFGLAYRMTGSAMDAEDLVQEAFIQFLKHDPAGLREPRALLSTIVTRRALDFLKSARVRRETYVGPWLPEPLAPADTLTDPAGRMEREESVSTAFLLMLETLSPIERAVYLLRDVFDFDYAEIGDVVERSAETCRRTASRARERLRQERGASDVAEEGRFPMPAANKERLLDQFLAACRGGDLDDLIGVLAADARCYSDGGGRVLSALNPIYGASNTGRFLLGVLQKDPPRFPLKVQIAGSPALALFDLSGKLDNVTTFEFEGDRVRQMFIVRNPEKLKRLARELRPGFARLLWYRLLYRWADWMGQGSAAK